MTKCIPNIISASRGAAAVALLLAPTFSAPFWALYGWCGLSDMIDGPLARKLDAVSREGGIIDSAADVIFLLAAAIKILPTLTLPTWLILWTILIALAKILSLTLFLRRTRTRSPLQITPCSAPPCPETSATGVTPHRPASSATDFLHNTANKLTGLLLFLLPFAIQWLPLSIPAAIVCLSATLSAALELRSLPAK